MVAAMLVMAAGRTLLLDVRDLAVGCDFAVVARDATACQSSEAEETNKAHHAESLDATGSNSCTAEFVVLQPTKSGALLT
jgi:hypothetical protein